MNSAVPLLRLAPSFALAILVACSPDSPKPIGPILGAGDAVLQTEPRPGFGTLRLEVSGDRLVRLQAARTTDGGHRRRLVVTSRADGALLWRYPETDEGTEFLDDVAVHPSGDVTLTVEHSELPSATYEVLRFDEGGELLSRQPVTGALVPPEDLGDLPNPPFRMRSPWADDALAEGWVRVVADGEDAIVAFQTEVAVPDGEYSPTVVSAVSWLERTDVGYVETRTRVVDGRHAVGPAAWAYDEFRWRQAAVRPYLALDPVTHHVVVGRAWNNRRCETNVAVWGELEARDCVFGSVSPVENEWLPFAWTSFSADGAREGTHVFLPDASAEFVVFEMDVRGGVVALAGSRVHEEADGSVAYYDGNLVPYDGYVALLDRASGELVLDRRIDGSGRADALVAIHFVDGGVLAAGASDWDRWSGGMSISRGADPWLAFVSSEGEVTTRRVAVDAPDRHTHLLAFDVADDHTIVAGGLSDAPMTHSGDGGNLAAMVFGDLLMTVRAR